MSGGLGIAAFVVMLLVVIMIHEAAHFGFAKLYGFKVEEFFVGFGPRLWSFRRNETEYGVKAIPAGGYVKIAGMNPFQPVQPDNPDYPRTYGVKPIWQRAIVIFAGPATHFVLAFIFFALWLGISGRPTDIAEFDRVERTLNGQPSPAAAAGLQAGDKLVRLAVNGDISVSDPSVEQFGNYVERHVGEPITIVVDREGALVSRVLVPEDSVVNGQNKARIGVILSEATEPVGIGEAIVGGVEQVGVQTVNSIEMIGRIFGPQGLERVGALLFSDAQREPTDPASVIGITRVASEIGETGQIGILLQMFGLINVFIGLLNLLPLPPFDGGHLAVLAIEKVRGRKVDMRKLVPVSAVVLMFFVTFTAAVVLVDLTKPLDLGP
jgi:membrane-associated protease RseP (regulator of RpoE activity)